ncbi:hypothetical protein [Alsobacter sp. SYSU BS001988]
MHGFFFPLTEVDKRHADCDPVSESHVDWLTRQGIPSSALAAPDDLKHAIVHFTGARFAFQDEVGPDEESEGALIFLLRDADGRPFDLAAWAPRSGRLGTWCGRAAVLGDPLGPRLQDHGALPVHPDPLGWLRSGRKGIVIIDRVAAARELHDLGQLAAMGGDCHVRELNALFKGLLPRVISGAKTAEGV